jgi:hypothetical protein
MKVFDAVALRVKQPDVIQLLSLVFAVLTFVTLVRWQTGNLWFNDSWFAVTQVRIFALTLIALSYGGSCATNSKSQQRATCVVVLLFALTTSPFEVATYAASYPSVSLSSALFIPLLTATAFYGLGLCLGSALEVIRSRSLLPLAIIGILLGMVALDIKLGEHLVNPFTATIVPTWQNSLLLVVGSMLTICFLAIPHRGTNPQPPPEGRQISK